MDVKMRAFFSGQTIGEVCNKSLFFNLLQIKNLFELAPGYCAFDQKATQSKPKTIDRQYSVRCPNVKTFFHSGLNRPSRDGRL